MLPGIEKVVLKDDQLFAVLDGNGDAPRIYQRELGLYYADTRCLDTWEMTVNDELLTVLSASERTPPRSCAFVMTNRDMLSLDYDGRIPRDSLCLRREVVLEDDRFIETIEWVNYDTRPHTLKVERRAGSRFNDIFEVRGMRREKRGTQLAPVLCPDDNAATLRYEGLDGRLMQTTIRCSLPCTAMLDGDSQLVLVQRFRLEPRKALTLTYTISFAIAGKSPALPRESGRKPSTHFHWPTLSFGASPLTEAMRRAEADIDVLLTRREGRLYPDAGIPWFCAPFGRDGLITSYQALPWCADIAEGVLDFVFAHLGRKDDPFTDEEPGKAFHEMRYGEMAATKEIPFIPYYGSVDSTPLCLILLAEYAAWTHRLDRVHGWWEAARSALDWVRRGLRRSPYGFLSYAQKSPKGLINQGWKDSHDSVMHADGRFAQPPIALAEVQGYAYRALRGMARLARTMRRDLDEARLWADEAAALRGRFDAKFWDEDRKMAVLALDGDGSPCRVLASNQGHCLWTRILDPGKAPFVAAHLMSPAMFTGFGIRTLAATEKAYNPLSYHNGSIWPHDNALIAEGLRLYDRLPELRELANGLVSVIEASDDLRIPELFCGFEKQDREGPVPYDVACKPQAWAAGSIFLVLKAMLGLSIDAETGSVVFKTPLLPKQVECLEMRGLVVRDEELDCVIRHGSVGGTVEILRHAGAAGRVVILN